MAYLSYHTIIALLNVWNGLNKIKYTLSNSYVDRNVLLTSEWCKKVQIWVMATLRTSTICWWSWNVLSLMIGISFVHILDCIMLLEYSDRKSSFSHVCHWLTLSSSECFWFWSHVFNLPDHKLSCLDHMNKCVKGCKTACTGVLDSDGQVCANGCMCFVLCFKRSAETAACSLYLPLTELWSTEL